MSVSERPPHFDETQGSPVAPQPPADVPAIDALRVVSINHRTASLEALDRAALGLPQPRALMGRLRDAGIPAVVLSTCNRFEIYWRARRREDDAAVAGVLGGFLAGSAPDWRVGAMRRDGVDAARHLFRVAAGLESLVVGESEVLGQVRAALHGARCECPLDGVLEQLFRGALRFGGRARAATGIGAGAMSAVSAALETMRATAPDLRGLTAVVVGAGQTGQKAARLLRSAGLGRLIVANRTPERARELAEALEGEWAPMEDLDAALSRADVLIAAIHAPAPLVTADRIRAALSARPRPLAIVDLSMPRAVAAEAAGLPGVTLVDLSRLEEVVGRSRAAREAEIPKVEAMLAPALEDLERDLAEASARPLVAELRIRAERIRRAEVERAVAAGIADPRTLDHVTRRIVDRLLSAPSAALREAQRLPQAKRSNCIDCVFGVAAEGSRASS